MKNKIRQLLRKCGVEIKRYRKQPGALDWLREMHVESVIDVGANVGQFSKEIAALLPSASICAFEPLHDCYLELSAAMSGRKEFEAFEVALGDMDETATIHRSSYSPSSSLLPMADLHKELFPHTRGSSPETIRVKRMDDVLRGRNLKKEILIKVDVQGYEDKVIAGGLETFGVARAVIIEASFVPLYDGQLLFDGIYERLKGLGFSYRGAYQQKRSNADGRVLFEDSVFLR